MSILEVKNLTFTYGDELIYKDANMRLFEGEHAAIVGPNGIGKSTLLKLLYKEILPDKGSIEWINYSKVGYLDQYAKLNPEMIVKNYLYDVFLPLFKKEEEMIKIYESISLADEKDYNKLLNRAHRIEEELIEDNFYSIQSTISNVINGLGLDNFILNEPIKNLSGGMRAKVILSKLLLEEKDVLLLDEPTNFLDIKHVEWLIKFLNGFKKTFLVVSHDEYFIRNIAKTVFSIENKQIERYKGNYDYYLKEREIRLENYKKEYMNQQKFIEKTEEFIRKNIVRASTSKMAQSRRKMLQKLPRLAKPISERQIKIRFINDTPTGRDVLKVQNLIIGYDEPLVEPLTFKITKGDKVVITGKNGVGKSTLIKTILHQLNPIEGNFEWIQNVSILYFEQLMDFDEESTPFEYVHFQHQDYDRKTIFGILASYGIDHEMCLRKIKTLSGGEKMKLKFALNRNVKSNCLILDEPTSHLDKLAKEALKEALIEYQGTVILVSHEASFYEDICDYEIHLSN